MRHVTSISHVWRGIEEHILVKNLLSLIFVVKDSQTSVTVPNIVEYIREKNLTAVMFVGKGSQMVIVM